MADAKQLVLVTTKPEEKQNDVIHPATKVLVEGVAGLAMTIFCGVLDGLITAREEKQEQEREARRHTIRTRIAAGEKIKKKEMLMILHWIDGTPEEIANEIKISHNDLKAAIKPWWNFL